MKQRALKPTTKQLPHRRLSFTSVVLQIGFLCFLSTGLLDQLSAQDTASSTSPQQTPPKNALENTTKLTPPANSQTSDQAATTNEIEIAPNLDLKKVVEQDDTASVSDSLPTSTNPNLTRNIPKNTHKASKKLILLGAEVPSSTSTRLSWKPASNISGLTSATPVLVINGAKAGPTVCLTAAVHGDELNGIEIIRRVMYNIDPALLTGRLIGVPVVNLLGFQRNTRYLPDRRDLNRFFPGDPNGSLASRIAYSLFNEVIQYCDQLIDLHTGSLNRTNLPQIRADMSIPSVAEFIHNFDGMIVVNSVGSEGMLRTAANKIGITAITLEVGESMRIQVDQIEAGTYSINTFLDRVNMYSRLFNWGKAQPAYYKSQWIRVQMGGILFSQRHLGDFVKQGDILGAVTNPINNKSSDIRSTVNGRIIGMATDQVVMPGFAAYHIGIRSTETELIEKGKYSGDSADLPEEENPE